MLLGSETHDLSTTLHTGEDRLEIVADARIDNRREIELQIGRKHDISELINDAAIIAAAYAHWGERCAERLIGDFAFAIHDRAQGILFAACDGMNMRTLYYAEEQGGVCVATTAQQLLSLPHVSREPNELALALWLHGYPDPGLSMYRDVRRLRPGYSLTANRDGLKLRKFWDLDPSKQIRYRKTEDYSDHFREILRQAVTDRMRSKVTAMQMSGGLDSTSVTALAQAEARRRNDSTIVISHRYRSGDAVDESPMIERVREHLEVDSHCYIDASKHLGLDYLQLYPPHADGPGSVMSPRYEDDLEAARSAGATVLLTGSGGDEMCWGHSLVYSSRLRRGNFAVIAEVIQGCREQQLPIAATLRQLLVSPLVPDWLMDRLRAFTAGDVAQSLLSDDAKRRLGLEEHIAEHSASDEVGDPVFRARYNALRWSSTFHSVRSHQLVAIRHGVDVVHPFFDRRIAEFSFAIPSELWLREGKPKWLLRTAMAEWLPRELLEQPHKVTFDDFFFRLVKAKQENVRQLLSHDSLAGKGLVASRAPSTIFEETLNKKRSFNVNLLFAIQLQAWMSVHQTT